jgi:hypothetical protein
MSSGRKQIPSDADKQYKPRLAGHGTILNLCAVCIQLPGPVSPQSHHPSQLTTVQGFVLNSYM